MITSLENIKLIIWDLDKTLWHGTISETNVAIVKRVYYDLSKKLLNISNLQSQGRKCSKLSIFTQTFVQRLRILKNNIVKRIRK